MKITDAQVRKLMEEKNKHGKTGMAAMMAGMDRKTARGYLKSGKLPSEIPELEPARRLFYTNEQGEEVRELLTGVAPCAQQQHRERQAHAERRADDIIVDRQLGEKTRHERSNCTAPRWQFAGI